MIETKISLPTFVERRWPLSGAPQASLALAVITLGMAGVILRGIMNNDAPLEIAGRIVLDAVATNAVAMVLAGLVLLVSVLSCLAAWRGRSRDRQVILSDSGIEAATSMLSTRRVALPYHGLTMRIEGRGPTLVELRGEGSAVIRLADQNFLNREAFDDFVEELGRRLDLTKEATVW